MKLRCRVWTGPSNFARHGAAGQAEGDAQVCRHGRQRREGEAEEDAAPQHTDRPQPLLRVRCREEEKHDAGPPIHADVEHRIGDHSVLVHDGGVDVVRQAEHKQQTRNHGEQDAAAALGAGLSPRAVAKGLRTFVLDPQKNPGRTNLFRLDRRLLLGARGVTAMVVGSGALLASGSFA